MFALTSTTVEIFSTAQPPYPQSEGENVHGKVANMIIMKTNLSGRILSYE